MLELPIPPLCINESMIMPVTLSVKWDQNSSNYYLRIKWHVPLSYIAQCLVLKRCTKWLLHPSMKTKSKARDLGKSESAELKNQGTRANRILQMQRRSTLSTLEKMRTGTWECWSNFSRAVRLKPHGRVQKCLSRECEQAAKLNLRKEWKKTKGAVPRWTCAVPALLSCQGVFCSALKLNLKDPWMCLKIGKN